MADTKSISTVDYLDKIKDVSESFREEFLMGETSTSYVNTGPPPNMKRRRLIFDSIRTIIEKDAGQNAGGRGDEDRGRYVYVFGAGYHGQLGRKAARGHKKYANIPIPVHLNEPVRQISCGALHSAVVTDDGKIYTWGDGRMGQLGHLQEGFSNQPVPTVVSQLSGCTVSQVACGQNHTLAVTDEGEVYSWGWAKYGQLGIGTRTNQRYPCKIQPNNSNFSLEELGSDNVAKKNGENNNNANNISNNYYTEGFKKIKQVSCGDRHSVCVTEEGLLYSFGSGEHGQLGHGNNHDQYIPKLILSLKENNLKIKQSDCGSIHTACITDNGELYIFGFGENLYGKNRRNFNYEPVHIPFKYGISQVQCGQSHVLILAQQTQDVYSWGDGSYGEIGQGAFKASQQPRLVLHGKNIKSIAAGRYHSSAVSNIGSLYTWGCGDNGQLGRPQAKQDNYSKRANSVPKLVVSLLGNVVGEISCGEHHTCVLSSCRYKTLAQDVQDWGKLEEMEFQAKLNLLSSSKQKGRGVSKKDLVKIRKWRKEEELRRKTKHEFDEKIENKKIEEEISKIAKGNKLRNQVKDSLKNINGNNKSTKDKNAKDKNIDQANTQTDNNTLPSIKESNNKDDTNNVDDNNNNNKDDNNNSNNVDAKKTTSTLPRVMSGTSLDGDTPNHRRIKNLRLQNKDGTLKDRVTAKQANQSRASFHETNRTFLAQMASQIFGVESQLEGEKNENELKQDMLLKQKFSYRKEYDKLKLVAQQKELVLKKLDEELAMLQEVDDASEMASQGAEMQLRKLGMKLNTVMIKISEAERSRRTYELNIVHIKDESQENHKQLDLLRRNLFHQENLRKKIAKFREYANRQKDFASLGYKEFQTELEDWRSFCDYQYRHLASLAKSATNNKENENSNVNSSRNVSTPMKERQAKKQQKAMHRISKLQRLVETNDKEMQRLNEQLQKYESEIDFYEDRFKRIYEATGLNDPEKIINKFFVNQEIQNEQEKILNSLLEIKTEKEVSLNKLDVDLKDVSSKQIDYTWREVDILSETLYNDKHKLEINKSQYDYLENEFIILKEWIIVLCNKLKYYLNLYDINKNDLDTSTFKLNNNVDVKQLLNTLALFIFTFLSILNDQKNNEGRYKLKHTTTNISTANNNINNAISSNNNSTTNKTSTKSRSSKKRTARIKK